MRKSKQQGFAIVEAVLIVVALVLLGGVGYYVVAKNGNKTETANQSTTVSTKTAKAPTAEVEQSLNQAVEVEAATDNSAAAEVEKDVDSAVDAASNVGDSFNENEL